MPLLELRQYQLHPGRRDDLVALFDRELDLHSLDAAGAEAVCDRIAATGALERVRARAIEMVAGAKAALEKTEFDSEQRQLLALVADGVVQRYS